MNVRQININTNQRQLKQNKSQNINKQYNLAVAPKQQPSFKGTGVMGGIDKFCLFIANLIENGGLFVSFTLQDMLGTNIPRPVMGLLRNSKENKGKKNTSFAAKELVREMLTGPSMFLIPMGMLKVGKPVLGQSINTPMKYIKALGDIHASGVEKAAGKVIDRQDYYKNVFGEILKNANVKENVEETASDLAQKLATLPKDKKERNKALSGLIDNLTTIVKNNADDVAHSDFTEIALNENAKAPIKDMLAHMQAYADDIIEKMQGKKFTNIQGYIKKVTNNTVFKRFATNALMYASVLAFLKIIPKLYNKAEGEGNAGLVGLMKDETLNDKSLETINNTKKENTNLLQAHKNKATPSFGSASTVVAKMTGADTVGKMFNAFEFEGYNVSFPMLLGIMAIGILIPRTMQAKDKYDREEILRRDLVTCATMCFAAHELEKGFSKLNEVKSGFVLASKDKGFKDKSLFKRFFDYIRPINGVKIMTTEQIKSKYSGIENYKEGIKGFCDFVSGQGGKLNKVFSIDNDVKTIIENLLQSKGKSIADADNATITKVLDEAKDSPAVQQIIEKFKNPDNAWVKKARTLNARFTALSTIVLVPAFLGFMLPAINERSTKKRIQQEQDEMKRKQAERYNSIDVSSINPNTKYKNIFSDIKAH